MVSRFIVALSLILFLAACQNQESTTDPHTIRIGVLPDESPERLQIKYKKLIAYLEETTIYKFDLVIPESYTQLLELYMRGLVDLAYLGGNTFAHAYEEGGATPVVMRHIDTEFVSYLFVRNNSDINSIHDLKAKRFSFGPRLSTSGHIMPRYFLQNELNEKPESFFKLIQYSANHTQTLLNVIDGTVDAGIANGQIVDTLMASDAKAAKLKIIWKSPIYPDYVWAMNPEFSDATVLRVQKAFLGLDNSNPQHQAILKDMRANLFVPASMENFEMLFAARDILSIKE